MLNAELLDNMKFPFETVDFLVIVFLLAVVLTIFRIMVTHKNSIDKSHSFPNGMKVGNTQLIGEKDSQNDYFAVMPTDDSLLAIIADGATNKKIGKFAAIVTIEILKNNFSSGLHKQEGINAYFQKSFNAINKRLNDNIYGNKVGATLIAVIIQNGFMHFASVGNCSLFLYRNGEMINVNDIQSTEIQISKISLEQKDVAMLCSKGARESLTEMEVLWQLSEVNHPYNKCQNLAKRIQQKRLGYQDNATIVVLEKMVRKTRAWGRD